jgi:TP901 family phage tail tape measure protein
MQPAAMLAVVVKAQGIASTNAQLKSVQANLQKVDAEGIAAGKSMQKSGAMMTSAGKKMTKAVTLPILAIGAASADMALNFGRDMNLIQTQAGASAKETAYLKKEVLGLAGATKFGPDELAKALFRVRSAGFKGAKGLAIMREGANLATLGNSDLEMTTKALTGAAKSLGLEGGKAFKHLAAEMNATVGTGDMRMEELQSALSTGVLPAFVAAGLGMRDYASALTVMTDRNVPAQIASTRLRTAVTMLVPHTKKAEEALGGIGIKSEALANIMRKQGLPQAIAYLAEHLDKLSANKANRVQIEAFGGAKSSATIEMLVQNYEELFEKEKLVGKGIGKYNSEIAAAERNPLVQLQKAWSGIEGDLIKIGEVVLPIVVPALLHTATAIGDVIDKFKTLNPHTQKTIVYIALLVAAIGPLLRIWGFLTTQAGALMIMLSKLGGTYTADAAAATEAAAANAELAASLTGVAGAQKELLIANASGTVTSTVPIAASTAASGAGVAEGAGLGVAAKSAAGSFAAGLGRMLPGALAIVGIGNIVASAVQGNQKAAIYKAGGAAAGALVGGIVGGVPGAMAGSGIGSIMGGLLESLISGKKLSPIQEQIQRQANHAADAIRNQRDAVKGLHQAENNMSAANKRHHESTEHVTMAHKHLNEAIHKFGPASEPARRAMHELTILEHRNALAAKGVEHAHRLSGHQLKLYRHETMEAVHAEKARLPAIDADIKHLNKKVTQEEKAGHEGKNYWKLMHEVTGKEKIDGKIRANIQKEIAEAAKVSGQKFADSLRHISTDQASLGKHFHGIVIGAHHVRDSMEEYATRGALANKHFAASAYKGQELFREDARKISEASGIAADRIEHRLAKALVKMGVSAVQFGVKDGKTGKAGAIEHKQHKQTGGMVVPGNTVGDKVAMTAMVEPHEIVHVLNSRASRDMRKLGALESINHNRPRFQKGGTMSGGVWRGISSAGVHPGAREAAEAVMAHFSGLEATSTTGGTHASGSYHYLGEAVDVGGGSRAEEFAAAEWIKKSGLFRSLVEGIHNPNLSVSAGKMVPPSFYSEVWADHLTHIHLAVAGAVGEFMGAAMAQPNLLSDLEITGPDGGFKSLAQGAANKQTDAANKYLKAHAPKGGKGGGGGALPGVSLKGVSGSVAAQAAQIVKRTHAEYIPTLALFEALWAESSMGASAPGNVLQGLGTGGAPIMDAASEISGFLTGHPTWTGTSAIGAHRSNPELPANAIAQLVQASGVGEGNEGRANYLQQKGAALATMRQFGLFTGGAGASTSMLMKKGGKEPSFTKSIKQILKGVKGNKHPAKYKGALKKLARHIEGVGLDPKRLDQMNNVSKDAEKFAEYAGNASSLTTQDEEGNSIQGIFQHRTEGEWLNDQLNSLMTLRREVIKAHGVIEKNYIPQVHKLLLGSRHRLREVEAAIRKAEQEKKDLEKKITEINKSQNETQHKIEKEINTMEHSIAEARRQPSPKGKAAKKAQQDRINTMEAQLEAKKVALSHSGAGSTAEIKKIHEEIKKIEKDQSARGRVQNALSGSIIPAFETKQTSLTETMAGLFGEGGEVKKKSFMGLQQIQGLGGSLQTIQGIPPIGTLGGEVLTVQARLQQIGEEAKKTPQPAGPSESAEEIASLEHENAEVWRKRNLVSESALKVLRQFPSVQAIAAAPFAGSFAKGGVMMAEVGEKGREVIAAPQGSRVVSKTDVDRSLRGGAPDFNFEEVHFHEAEGKVTGRVNGREFEKDVKDVTRKEAKGAAKPSPGSKRRRK